MMRSLTINELENISGVPRSTIYYYVREGLLPTAQKAAASRAIYTDHHVALMRDISRLKVLRLQAGVGESLLDGFPGERLHRAVVVLGEPGRADPYDINIVHAPLVTSLSQQGP